MVQPKIVRLARSLIGPSGGLPVILLHGSPTNRWVWAPQANELALAGFRVVLPDLRGHGETPVAEGLATVEAVAGDVFAMADELGMRQFVLGGFSWGGFVAFEMVREQPERILGLLFVSTRAEGDSERERSAKLESAAALRREGLRVDGYRDRVLSEETLRTRPKLWDDVRRMMLSVPAEGRAQALEGTAQRPDFRPLLPQIRVPTLVIVGAEDPITPPEFSKEMHKHIPGAFLQEVEGASHFVTLEAPGVVSQAILNWLTFVGVEPHTGPGTDSDSPNG